MVKTFTLAFLLLPFAAQAFPAWVVKDDMACFTFEQTVELLDQNLLLLGCEAKRAALEEEAKKAKESAMHFEQALQIAKEEIEAYKDAAAQLEEALLESVEAQEKMASSTDYGWYVAAGVVVLVGFGVGLASAWNF